MILYHVVSTYQLLCAIVHRRVSHSNDKAVLLIGDFLTHIYSSYKQLAPTFFDEVYVFPYMEIEHNAENLYEVVLGKYSATVKYDIHEYKYIYILGAHFYFTEILLHEKIPFVCFEEAAGMLSTPDRLEKIVRKKYKVQADWARENLLFDLSNPQIVSRYYLKRCQKDKSIDAEDFDVGLLMEKKDIAFRNECIDFFVKHTYVGGKNKYILLTEHLSELGIMSRDEQILFYKSLIHNYCEEKELIIKPHPSDTIDYFEVFPNAEIITDKFPSELLPFVFEEKPDNLLTLGSTAVHLLESHFKISYIGGEKWLNIYLDHSQINKFMLEEKIMGSTNDYIKPAYSARNIPIAISCSNEYVKYLSVLIQSILDTSSDENNYDILILNRGIEERNQLLIKQQCNKTNISVRFVSTNKYIENGKYYTEGLSIEAYFRMFLIDIMYNYEKTLYLDVDTFVMTDVAELYNLDIGNNYIAAAVDINIVASYVAKNHWKPYIDDVIKLDNPYEYVQSGVMILNLKKLREDFSLDYLIEVSTREKWRLYDQDVLNHICKNNIFFLDPIFNVINIQEGRLQNIEKYAPEDLKTKFFEAYKNPKIVHFVGKKKPWISFNTDYSEFFWLAARKTSYYEMLLINRILKIDLLEIKNTISRLIKREESKKVEKNIPIITPQNNVKKVVDKFSFIEKQNREIITEKVVLFRCQSVYQLLNAIVIKLTILKDVKADLVLTMATDFSAISEKLIETKIFRKVLFSTDTPQTYLDWRGLDPKRQKEISEKPVNYILPIEMAEDYTDYYIAVGDEYNKLFYYYMLHKGISTKIHFFEDGMNSYILNNVELCKTDFINHEYYGDFAFDKNIVEHLVYETSVVVDKVPNINYIQMPKIDTLSFSDKQIFNKLFEGAVLPTQKYIFLEEAFFQDGIASTDVELLEEIAELVGKDNIIVKMHPRNKVDRFSARGFKVMDNITTPWEVVLLHSDISQKVFLTISSTAAISAGLSFDKEFKAIYMYKVMSLGMNIHVRQKKFSEFMQLAKGYVNRSMMQIMIPSSHDELVEDLIYVEKGI